ncbi:MAG: 50S ribosomal protein L7/L12 [candidate division WOR-3 bacterium]
MSNKKNIEAVVEAIENLTVVELAELVKLLQDKFGVSAQPVVTTVGQAPTGQVQTEAAKEEKTDFSITLISAGDKKIQALKVLRELTGLSLQEAKSVIESLPKVIKEGATKDEANNFKTKLEEVGAKVEVK